MRAAVVVEGAGGFAFDQGQEPGHHGEPMGIGHEAETAGDVPNIESGVLGGGLMGGWSIDRWVKG
jgi:hypothetical protein